MRHGRYVVFQFAGVEKDLLLFYFRAMRLFILMLFLIVVSTPPTLANDDAWVATDRLNRRTCPSTECGVVGWLMFRERATIFESKGGWSRVSKYYDGSCRNGKSDYVESGNSNCSAENGFVQGRFAEWVYTKHLSVSRPPDPSVGATGVYALVSQSDDYRTYKDVFAKAATELIESGQCTEQDFVEIGGWLKSTSRSGSWYFTYCGGMHASNKVYLNASTGTVSR